MKVLFNIIATGNYYDTYSKSLINSLRAKTFSLFEKDFLIFTDNKKFHGSDNYISHFPWPINTLMRFYYMNRFIEFYNKYDYVYYIDSDMLVNQNINDELLPDSSGLVGVEHPLQKRKILNSRPSFEDNINSTAYLKETPTEIYFQGCLFGGTSKEFSKLVISLNENTNKDLKNNIIAKWHDESHLNWYFNEVNKPKVLTPDYCWPEAFPNLGLSPKIIHLHKK